MITEIRHFPKLNEANELVCEQCETLIDLEAFKAGGGFVVEIPLLGFVPTEHYALLKAIPCTNTKAVEKLRSKADATAELLETEARKERKPNTDDKFKEERKMMATAAWNNFLMMREMTKLREDG